MKLFGEKIGIAFQIKDDMLDFGNSETGKPHGIDIQEKKLTLPLIYALQQAGAGEKRKVINIIKNHHHDRAKVEYVIAFVNGSGGIKYAAQKMDNYKMDALKLLTELPESPSKVAMVELVNFTTERTR